MHGPYNIKFLTVTVWEKKYDTKFKIPKWHFCAAKRKKKPDLRTDAEG
jgi:hypothetical protein